MEEEDPQLSDTQLLQPKQKHSHNDQDIQPWNSHPMKILQYHHHQRRAKQSPSKKQASQAPKYKKMTSVTAQSLEHRTEKRQKPNSKLTPIHNHPPSSTLLVSREQLHLRTRTQECARYSMPNRSSLYNKSKMVQNPCDYLFRKVAKSKNSKLQYQALLVRDNLKNTSLNLSDHSQAMVGLSPMKKTQLKKYFKRKKSQADGNLYSLIHPNGLANCLIDEKDPITSISFLEKVGILETKKLKRPQYKNTENMMSKTPMRKQQLSMSVAFSNPSTCLSAISATPNQGRLNIMGAKYTAIPINTFFDKL